MVDIYTKIKKLRSIMTDGKFVEYDSKYNCYPAQSYLTMQEVCGNRDGLVLQLWPQEKITPWYGENVKE
jgi:hypothetical protein